MAKDLYAEQLRLLQQYWPDLQIEEGARVQLVAALVCPSDEYRQLLEVKAENRRLRQALRSIHADSCGGYSADPDAWMDSIRCKVEEALSDEYTATLPLELEVAAS